MSFFKLFALNPNDGSQLLVAFLYLHLKVVKIKHQDVSLIDCIASKFKFAEIHTRFTEPLGIKTHTDSPLLL